MSDPTTDIIPGGIYALPGGPTVIALHHCTERGVSLNIWICKTIIPADDPTNYSDRCAYYLVPRSYQGMATTNDKGEIEIEVDNLGL